MFEFPATKNLVDFSSFYLRLFVAASLADIGGADIVHAIVALIFHIVTTIVESCMTCFIAVTISVIVIVISTVNVTVVS